MENINIQDLINRIIKRLFIIIPLILITAGISYINPTKSTFLASVGVKVELTNLPALQSTNSEDISKGISSDIAYTQILPILNKYVYSQFSSVQIQDKFAKKINVATPPNVDKKLIYTIIEASTPFVFINYLASNESEAKAAIIAIKELASTDLVINWNTGKSDKFKITSFVTPEETIIKQSPATLQKFLPAIAIGLLALFASILIPIKKI
jgi:hypothetical protein